MRNFHYRFIAGKRGIEIEEDRIPEDDERTFAPSPVCALRHAAGFVPTRPPKVKGRVPEGSPVLAKSGKWRDCLGPG